MDFSYEDLKDLTLHFWKQNPYYYDAEKLGKGYCYEKNVTDLLFLKSIPLNILKRKAEGNLGQKYPLYHLYNMICLYRKYKYLFLIKLFGNFDVLEKNWINTSYSFIKKMNPNEISEQAIYCINEILKD